MRVLASKYTPHKYQDIATNTILNNNYAGLFLDMGLGKTVSTLTALEKLKNDSFEVKKILVIAPLRVADKTWTDEINKWEHLQGMFRVSKILGSEAERLRALKADADLYLINRENVTWLVDVLGSRWDFDTVVIDELSSFKSSSSKRFRSLKKIRPLCKRVIGLTGTPAPNGLMDLWAEMYLLDRGERLGKTLTSFRDKYFRPGRRNGHIVFDWIIKEGAEEQIWDAISDITISMKAVDWLSLPECINITVPVEMDKKSRAKYEQLKRDKVLPLLDDTTLIADTAAAVSNKLLQMANGRVYDEDKKVIHIHDHKLDALEQIVEEAQGETVLIFYNYKHDLEAILSRFPDAELLKDSKSIERFCSRAHQKEGRQKSIFVTQPQQTGHGLNIMSGGHISVWYGLTWNLELYQQACARLHRQGQTETVRNYHLITKDTIDEDVYEALSTKATTQNELMEAIKRRMKEVTTL